MKSARQFTYMNSLIDSMNAETERVPTFSSRLKQLRMQKGLSQKAFAELVDVHPVQYNRYETGDNIPASELLTKIADALGVTVDYLLDGKNEEAAVAKFEDKDLLNLFSEVEKLKAEDKLYIKKVVEDLLKVKKIQQLAS
jgi:transcriptional regulator with XRE-family HTH domain